MSSSSNRPRSDRGTLRVRAPFGRLRPGLLAVGIVASACFAANAALAQAYHFSTAGDDGASGTAGEPKASLPHAAELLAPGVTIRLRRGDVWYVGRSGWVIADKQGTTDQPMQIEAYGAGALPVVANLDLLSSPWTDEGSSRWSHPIPGGGDDIARCFVNGEGRQAVPLGELDGPLAYAVSSGRLYLHAAADPSGLGPVEVSISFPALRLTNVAHLALREIAFHGGTWAGMALVPPTAHVTIDRCEVRRAATFGIRLMPPSNAADRHDHPIIIDSLIHKDWTTQENPVDAAPGGDGIGLDGAVEGGSIRGNRVVDFGHTNIRLSGGNAAHHGVHNVVVELNEVWADASSYVRGFETMGLPDKCTNNVVRRNLFRDLRQRSKAMGTGNQIYSNVFVAIRASTVSTKATGGHLAIVGAWDGKESRDNVIVHNTFVDSDGSSVESYLHADGIVGENVIRNNLFLSYGQAELAYGIALTSESGTPIPDQQVQHNCFWNGDESADAVRIGNQRFTADEANQQLAGYAGNLQADPALVDVAQRDFRLAEGSPCRELGEPVPDLGPGVVDYLGHPFDPVHPSVGAFQYRELPTCQEAGGTCCADGQICTGGSTPETSDCAQCCVDGSCGDPGTGGAGGAGQGGGGNAAAGAPPAEPAPAEESGCDCALIGPPRAAARSLFVLAALLLGLQFTRPRAGGSSTRPS